MHQKLLSFSQQSWESFQTISTHTHSKCDGLTQLQRLSTSSTFSTPYFEVYDGPQSFKVKCDSFRDYFMIQLSQLEEVEDDVSLSCPHASCGTLPVSVYEAWLRDNHDGLYTLGLHNVLYDFLMQDVWFQRELFPKFLEVGESAVHSYEAFGLEVSVRSNAKGGLEDSPQSSGAGQFHTVNGVSLDKDSVAAAVKAVFLSYYRGGNVLKRQDNQPCTMSVIIQKFIPFDHSFVVFSDSNFKSKISWSTGACQSVVDGKARETTFFRHPLKTDSQINLPFGTPRNRKVIFSIQQVISKLGPSDIEGGIRGGKIYFVQRRGRYGSEMSETKIDTRLKQERDVYLARTELILQGGIVEGDLLRVGPSNTFSKDVPGRVVVISKHLTPEELDYLLSKKPAAVLYPFTITGCSHFHALHQQYQIPGLSGVSLDLSSGSKVTVFSDSLIGFVFRGAVASDYHAYLLKSKSGVVSAVPNQNLTDKAMERLTDDLESTQVMHGLFVYANNELLRLFTEAQNPIALCNRQPYKAAALFCDPQNRQRFLEAISYFESLVNLLYRICCQIDSIGINKRLVHKSVLELTRISSKVIGSLDFEPSTESLQLPNLSFDKLYALCLSIQLLTKFHGQLQLALSVHTFLRRLHSAISDNGIFLIPDLEYVFSRDEDYVLRGLVADTMSKVTLHNRTEFFPPKRRIVYSTLFPENTLVMHSEFTLGEHSCQFQIGRGFISFKAFDSKFIPGDKESNYGRAGLFIMFLQLQGVQPECTLGNSQVTFRFSTDCFDNTVEVLRAVSVAMSAFIFNLDHYFEDVNRAGDFNDAHFLQLLSPSSSEVESVYRFDMFMYVCLLPYIHHILLPGFTYAADLEATEDASITKASARSFFIGMQTQEVEGLVMLTKSFWGDCDELETLKSLLHVSHGFDTPLFHSICRMMFRYMFKYNPSPELKSRALAFLRVLNGQDVLEELGDRQLDFIQGFYEYMTDINVEPSNGGEFLSAMEHYSRLLRQIRLSDGSQLIESDQFLQGDWLRFAVNSDGDDGASLTNSVPFIGYSFFGVPISRLVKHLSLKHVIGHYVFFREVNTKLHGYSYPFYLFVDFYYAIKDFYSVDVAKLLTLGIDRYDVDSKLLAINYKFLVQKNMIGDSESSSSKRSIKPVGFGAPRKRAAG